MLKLDLKQCCSIFRHQRSFQPNLFSLFFDQIAKNPPSLVRFYLQINEAVLCRAVAPAPLPSPVLLGVCGVCSPGKQSPLPVHLNFEFKLQSSSLTLTQTRAWLRMLRGCSQPGEPWGADALPRPQGAPSASCRGAVPP